MDSCSVDTRVAEFKRCRPAGLDTNMRGRAPKLLESRCGPILTSNCAACAEFPTRLCDHSKLARA